MSKEKTLVVLSERGHSGEDGKRPVANGVSMDPDCVDPMNLREPFHPTATAVAA
jgi:hypothetical protein